MMSLLLIFFVFLFGIIIGSFLNVVIYRFNTGMGVDGRSMCFSCSKTLQWYELIPVVSFLVLRGKCSSCKSKISWQYPLVESFTGGMFVAVFLKYQHLLEKDLSSFVYLFLFTISIFIIYTIIFVYDLKHKIIPDSLSGIAALVTFIGLFISTTGGLHIALPTFSHLLAGPALATPFALLWLISRGRWMGLGDAKLAISMGWFLGLMQGITSVMFAFWIGAIVGVLMVGVQRVLSAKGSHLTMKSEIPFAPFLIIGLALVFFTSVNILFI